MSTLFSVPCPPTPFSYVSSIFCTMPSLSILLCSLYFLYLLCYLCLTDVLGRDLGPCVITYWNHRARYLFSKIEQWVLFCHLLTCWYIYIFIYFLLTFFLSSFDGYPNSLIFLYTQLDSYSYSYSYFYSLSHLYIYSHYHFYSYLHSRLYSYLHSRLYFYSCSHSLLYSYSHSRLYFYSYSHSRLYSYSYSHSRLYSYSYSHSRLYSYSYPHSRLYSFRISGVLEEQIFALKKASECRLESLKKEAVLVRYYFSLFL